MIGKKMAAGFRISMAVFLFILTEGLANIAVEKEIIWLERAIGENGDQLKIGEADQGECFSSNVQSVSCRPYPNWEDQKEFLTRVYKLPDTPNGASKKMQVKDYFFALKRDLWGCTAQGDPNNAIWRMEVELMGITEIASIQYHKDYDVSTKYYLSDAKQKRRTAWVEGASYYKKIQYANGDLKTIRCKYEGRRTIVEQKAGLGHWFLDRTDRTNTVRNELKEPDYKRSLMIELSTNENLPTIWIGKQYDKYKDNKRQLGKKETTARCEREQGVKPTPTRFYTKVKVQKGTSTGGEPVWISLTGEEQLQYIIPLKQQVWKCRAYTKSKSGKETYTYTFYRIVNEMVSKVELFKVQFGFTVVEALITNLPLDTTDGLTKIGFKITEIVYRFPLTHRSMNYLGSLEFLEDDVSAKDHPQREVSYYLQPKVVYETFIGKRGFDLRVGSRLVGFGQDGSGRIGSRDTLAQCTKEKSEEYNKAFNTQIKLVTSIGNEAFGTSRIQKYMEPEYYTYNRRTVANCSFIDEKKQMMKYFIRIMNVIEVRVPVRTIQTYDTVSVAFTFRPNNEKAVRIVEIKYLDPEYDYSVGRYDGRVDFSSEDLKVPDPDYSIYEVKRTNDDITRIVGPYQWGDVDLRYFDYTDKYRKAKVGDGEYDLKVGSEQLCIQTMQGLTETSVARCSNIQARTDIQEYSQFTLTKIKKRVRSRFGKEADDNVKVQDIIGFKWEWLWKCTVHEPTPITFYFVENEVTIKNPAMLRDVHYYNGDRLSPVELEDGHKEYRIKRMYFLDKIDADPKTPPRVIKYPGYIVMEQKRKDTSLFKSGTEQIMGKSKYVKRVYEEQREYHLRSDEFMYRTVINYASGVTLKLGGARWERIMPSHITGMQCVEKQKRELQGQEISIHAFEHFNTFFRTEVSEVGGRENVFDNYFKSLKKEYWECTPKSVKTSASEEERRMKMIRIVNQFSVKPQHCNTIKEMHHYDGFTFMVGEADVGKPGCMEINHITYLRQLMEGECEADREGELIVTKYEGRITLIDGSGREVLSTVAAARLKNVARKDTMYLLPEDGGKTVFRKVLAPFGIVVAIGTPHQKFDNKERFVQISTEMRKSIFKCEQMPTEEENQVMHLVQAYRMIIRANLYDDDVIELFKSRNAIDVQDYFVRRGICQKCLAKESKNLGTSEKVFYRCRHVYTLRDNLVVSSVFHTDGVKVHTSNADHRLQIEHIIYYNFFMDRIRFDGFIADEGLSTTDLKHSKELEFASDFIHYHDFSSIEEQCEAKIKGVYLEVGSPYAYDITSGEDDVAYCYKNHESYVSKPAEAFSTRIFSRRSILEDNQDNHYSKINGFVIIKQELYWCLTVMHKKFYRVMNEIIDASQIDKIHGIYHHDGVTILHQNYPPGHDQLDVTSSIRITEVKYLQSDSNKGDEVYKVVRYDGEIRVISEIDKNIITWFQMPSVLKEYPIEAGHDPSEEKILRDHNYWPVEVLKALALKQKLESFNEQLPYPSAPRTQKDNQRVLANVIPGKNRWRFMIGTPWEIYRNEPDKSLRCILDEWNPKDYFQFNTDAVLYVMDETDEKIHNYLDEETILDYFKLNRTEVWVCVNKDQETFLRVVTELVGIVPMQLIEHYDSVQVESVKIPGEYGEKSNTAKITETKIVDANTLQTVRYDGLVKLLRKTPPRPQPSFMGWTKRQVAKIIPGRRGG